MEGAVTPPYRHVLAEYSERRLGTRVGVKMGDQ